MSAPNFWEIDVHECEIFSDDDAFAEGHNLSVALEALPLIFKRLVINPESGVSTDGTAALSLSSSEFDRIVQDRVVLGLTVVYDLVPEQRRVVLRKIKLLPALDAERDQLGIPPVGVASIGDAYKEPPSKMVGKKTPVDVSEFDTRPEDSPATLLIRPRMFQVFRGLGDGDD